jgi:hypothetical protein
VYPEKELVEPRLQAQKRSMKRAGLIMGAVLGGFIAAGMLWSKRR